MKKSSLIYCFVIGLLLACGERASSQAIVEDDPAYGKIVKEIRIIGLRFTKEYIIIRALASQVGKPYIIKNAREDYLRLDRLGIFSYTRITPIVEDDEVILEIEVKETFPYLPSFKFQITDENGVSVGLGFTISNFRKRGEFLSAGFLVGGVTNFEVKYDNPWITWNHLSTRVEYYHRERHNKLDDFDEKTDELWLRAGSFIGEYGRIGGRYSFIYLISDRDGVTLSPDNRDNISTLAFFIGYDSRNLWSNPTRGWWNEIEFSKTGGFMGGDGDYETLILDFRRFIPTWNRQSIGLFSLATIQFGIMDKTIPLHQDFHLGGSNSIRGWSLDSRRGKNQFINTLEYRFNILEPKDFTLPLGINYSMGLQVAIIGDFGIAWDKSRQFAMENFIGGYGLGFRVLVPVAGMLRFDLVWGEAGKGVRFHVGGREKAVRQRERVR
jgi:outer membrane protein insertion porin family